MIVKTGEEPNVVKQFDAMLCWLSETPLSRPPYWLRHTTREVKAKVANIAHRVDLSTPRQ